MSTSIGWTRGDDGSEGETWNVVRGCDLCSPGCSNCYAMKQAHRFSGPCAPYEGLTRLRTKGGAVWTGTIRLVPEKLCDPLGWRKPRRIFVCSMSDLFHEDVPTEYIAAVFGVMAACPKHTFQLLTKRADRMHAWFRWLDEQAERARSVFPNDEHKWLRDHVLRSAALRHGCDMPNQGAQGSVWPLPNVHLGVSVENQAYADERIPLLLDTPAAIRYVSAEPLLGPTSLARYLRTLDVGPATFHPISPEQRQRYGDAPQSIIITRRGSGLDWVIVGGESGGLATRPFAPEWARLLVQQCAATTTPIFVKQIGSWRQYREFRSFEQWVDKAKTWLRGAHAKLIDAKGRPCPDGASLMQARDEGTFPVTAYVHVIGKGEDPADWDADLRVQQFPRVA